MNYAREAISRIAGYVPGEQPQGQPLIKLNTNENPYPPSPKVAEALREFDWQRLRLYSEPSAKMVREAAAKVYGVKAGQILCGNGSDDLLTIALRTFVGEGEKLAYTEPSYSLYPVLADLQGAVRQPVALNDAFDLEPDAWKQAADAKLFIFARPNAPTGTNLDKAAVRAVCENFKGVVWIDEAYVDFSGDNCLSLIDEYPNVVVSRTMSKSFSLAGLRLGIAFANEALIYEMNKVKDSYNVDMISQIVATAALNDMAYMQANAARIRDTRDWLAAELTKIGCKVLPSCTNFLFVETKRPAGKVFQELKEARYLVRYFNLPRISQYIRITIGKREDMEGFLKTITALDAKQG